MRKLATIRRISKIHPIPDAENIELAIIDGWQVVVKKHEFRPGDLGIYCEIDSFLPMTDQFEFLSSRGLQTIANGTQGHRLKTAKLCGQISQGLFIPIPFIIPDNISKIEGFDCTEVLGIQLYEPKIPAELNGEVKGPLPSFIQKTDEERIQNHPDYFERWAGHKFTVTEKLDGTSFTAYLNKGKFGVCGRNYEFNLDTQKKNTYLQVAKSLDLERRLRVLGKNIAIQGELIGEGIQKNRYKIKGHAVRFFTVFDIDKRRPMSPNATLKFLKNIDLKPVPVIKNGLEFSFNIDSILSYAEGKSELSDSTREGLVFRHTDDSRISFKVISNKFLLNE
jgi:RNA ligase (TIGR02306 family)